MYVGLLLNRTPDTNIHSSCVFKLRVFVLIVNGGMSAFWHCRLPNSVRRLLYVRLSTWCGSAIVCNSMINWAVTELYGTVHKLLTPFDQSTSLPQYTGYRLPYPIGAGIYSIIYSITRQSLLTIPKCTEALMSSLKLKDHSSCMAHASIPYQNNSELKIFHTIHAITTITFELIHQ